MKVNHWEQDPSENMGDEEDDSGNDEDSAYERYRDDWGDKLQETMTDTYNMFVKAEKGYYSGNDEKFLDHIISILLSMTNTHIEVLDEKGNRKEMRTIWITKNKKE